jgi:hypothetical protein
VSLPLSLDAKWGHARDEASRAASVWRFKRDRASLAEMVVAFRAETAAFNAYVASVKNNQRNADV